jgi:hypothetical protein
MIGGSNLSTALPPFSLPEEKDCETLTLARLFVRVSDRVLLVCYRCSKG